LQDVVARGCDCTGNCGRSSCKRERNKQQRSLHRAARRYCRDLASSQGTLATHGLAQEGWAFFCSECRCEMYGCNKQRQRQGNGRWCIGHKSDEQPGVYYNCFGQHEIDVRWSEELSQAAGIPHVCCCTASAVL